MDSPWFEVAHELAERLVEAPQVLLCLDFDGTLAPLVDDPAQARLPTDVSGLLRKLAEHPRGAVAIISGRERTDLQSRIGLPGISYAGNHGLEMSGSGFVFVEPTAAASGEPLNQLAGELTARLQAVSGVLVENKGLTLTVHYRRVAPAAWDEVRRLVHATLANAAYPFQLTTGIQSYEIRPRVEWNKGTAVVWLRERLGLEGAPTIYVGDDQTDEDAFAVLSDGITIKVGLEGETAARYRVASASDVPAILHWLHRCLETAQPQTTR